MREIVDVEPSSRNEEAETEYKIEECGVEEFAGLKYVLLFSNCFLF